MTHNTSGNAIKLFILVASFVLAAPAARAGGPVVWELNSREELLKGEARGVSVTDTGALMLAPRIAQIFDTQQAYVWSTAADAAGNVYLGTGHDGRVFRVASDGRGALLYDAAELDVTALAVGRDGALYAGTSPDGKVYRVAAGATASAQAEVFFDPPDKYIWSLAVMGDGALAVGTGDAGKIYRVRAAGAKAEESLLVDINETHVMSLAVDSRGDLVAGTDPGGLVIRVNAQGKAFALFDAPLREIHSLASAPDGSLYVLALGEAASSSRPQGAVTAASAANAGGSVSTVTMTVTDDGGGQAAQLASQPQQPARSRNELANARSAVFRVLADGGSDVLWSSQAATAFSVAPAPQGGVLIGTSDKGRIYHVTDDGRDTLLVQSSEDQISSLVVRGRDVLAASSNQGKLFRLTAEPAGEGTYESPVRDARFSSAWGRIWWRGRGAVELQTRTGNTERPDQTWSEWSEPYRAASGAAVTSPRARFIQWRAILRAPAAAGGGTAEAARVEGVSVAYLPRNVAPEVVQVTTLPVGVALLTAVQVQIDPNLEASGLDPALIQPVAQAPPRRAFQRGAIAVQWQAEDRNGDTLEYSVYYRALGETDFHLLREGMRENFFTVDGAALGDGRYVFRVVASDAPDNSVGAALKGERTGEPVQIDNTPPVVRPLGKPAMLAGLNTSLSFTAEDAGGMIRRADVSVDGGPWRAVFPQDGIADSPAETFQLSLPLEGPGEHIVALRVFDAGGNTGNARVVVRK